MTRDNPAAELGPHHDGPIEIAADSHAPARAREVISAAGRWTAPQVVDDASLVVSEVVSNVVRHTDSRSVSVAVRASPSALHVEVRDDDPDHVPQIRSSRPEEPGGLGMHIVRALCVDWGHRRADTGKCVWFHVEAPTNAAPAH